MPRSYLIFHLLPYKEGKVFNILKFASELKLNNNLRMSTKGRILQSEAAQVLRYDGDQKLVFLPERLEDILLKDGMEDREVAVISIAGAYRGGKSFLLNFFLRYLCSKVSMKQIVF